MKLQMSGATDLRRSSGTLTVFAEDRPSICDWGGGGVFDSQHHPPTPVCCINSTMSPALYIVVAVPGAAAQFQAQSSERDRAAVTGKATQLYMALYLDKE